MHVNISLFSAFLQMFFDLRKAVSHFQASRTISLAAAKPDNSKNAISHEGGDYIPADDECYEGSVVNGSVVWKGCGS